jgi:hypothetical protein
MVAYLPFLLLYLLVGGKAVLVVLLAVLVVTVAQVVVVVGITVGRKPEVLEIHQAHLLMVGTALLRLHIKVLTVVMVMNPALVAAVVGVVGHRLLAAIVVQAQEQTAVTDKHQQFLALQ